MTPEQLDEFKQLLNFYDVDNLTDLIRAQEAHILRLQATVSRQPLNKVLSASPVRSA